MVSDLLDVVLYEFIPWCVGSDVNLNCQIIAATRSRTKGPRDENGIEPIYTLHERENLTKRYGISFDKNTYYRSLTETSFIPVVSQVILLRNSNAIKNVNVIGAVGSKLEYEDSKKFPVWARHAHYIADIICNCCFISVNNNKRDVFRKYFEKRMDDVYDDSFVSSVDASRYMDSGDFVSSMISAYFAAMNCDIEKPHKSIIPKIHWRVMQGLKDLRGPDFVEFTHDINNLSLNNRPKRKAQVCKLKNKNIHQNKTSKTQSQPTAKDIKKPENGSSLHVEKPVQRAIILGRIELPEEYQTKPNITQPTVKDVLEKAASPSKEYITLAKLNEPLLGMANRVVSGEKQLFRTIREYIQKELGDPVNQYILQVLSGANERKEAVLKVQLTSADHYEVVISATRQIAMTDTPSWREVY